MGKLHELLAAEKTVVASANTLLNDTATKFQKVEYFHGHTKTLAMLKDSPENKAIEEAAREERAMPTTVRETLDYMFDIWARAEDLLASKNETNTVALADIEFRGKVIATKVPVDTLMGLEARLEKLRTEVLVRVPTIDAARNWRHVEGDRPDVLTSDDQVVSKTQKIMYPVVMAEATEKHAAQVKEATRDEVVGTFRVRFKSGAATAVQKSNSLQTIDELIIAVKKARQRANAVEARDVKIGSTIKQIVMADFT